MKKYFLKRLGYSLISLFLLSLTIFLFVRLSGLRLLLGHGFTRTPAWRRLARPVRRTLAQP